MDAMKTPLGAWRSALVLGGARSGKSAFAQGLAERACPERIYVATAEDGDGEMHRRIALHRAARGAGWTTVETPVDLKGAIAVQARADRVLLVDCLTLWLSNLMMARADVGASVDALAECVGAAPGRLAFVSNEIGLGLVPETPLGREFRDWQGVANQRIAAACDLVVFVAAGCPLLLKPAPGVA